MTSTRRIRLLVLASALLAALGAFAQPAGCVQDLYGKVHCGPPESRCIADRRNELWCSPPGGAVELDAEGHAVCGVGQCTKDQRGGVFCAATPRGGAMTDAYGKVACVGGCAPASPGLCTRPMPLSAR